MTSQESIKSLLECGFGIATLQLAICQINHVHLWYLCLIIVYHEIYAEIQDGHKKMAGKRKNRQLTADTLGVKNFAEITLSRTVSEINAYLPFMQKFKMAPKMAEILSDDSPDTLGAKNFVEIAVSGPFLR